MLGGVLAWVAALVPPWFQTDTGVGSPASLNMCVGLLGSSGPGKPSASEFPTWLIPALPYQDFPGGITLGSGEGIAEPYMGEKTLETGETHCYGLNWGAPGGRRGRSGRGCHRPRPADAPVAAGARLPQAGEGPGEGRPGSHHPHFRLRSDLYEGDLSINSVALPANARGGFFPKLPGDMSQLTLTGMLRDPPTNLEGSLAFARSLPVPGIYEAVRDAEPLDDGAFADRHRRRRRRTAASSPATSLHVLQAALQGGDPDARIAMALPLDLAVADTAPSFGHAGTKLPLAKRRAAQRRPMAKGSLRQMRSWL